MAHDTGIRLDKWLWYARFFKTRGLAAAAVASGVRLNGARISKAATIVRPDDIVTFKQARQFRAVKVLACGERRGPASEAQQLYEEITAS